MTVSFRECDDNQDNFISTRELGWAMRVMGHNPTEAELQELANRVSVSSRASNEGRFLKIMRRHYAIC